MNQWKIKGKLAVAVSGGCDSLSLADFISGWLNPSHFWMILTVNHNLRPESKDEAEFVYQWAQDRKIPARILTCPPPRSHSRMQENARFVRYEILRQACLEEGLSTLATAHHQDDQIETVMMRLQKGTGLKGFSGISSDQAWKGVRLIRPLLQFTRTEIQEYARDRGLSFREDPSNQNPQFWRSQFRNHRPHLEQNGWNWKGLLQTHRDCEDANHYIESVLLSLEDQIELKKDGVIFPLLWWDSLHQYIQKRLLSRTIQTVSKSLYPPSHQTLIRILKDLGENRAQFTSRTVQNCLITVQENRMIIKVHLDPRRKSPPVFFLQQ
jgi:tRNA(Ile)-lysidine synthase